MMSTRRRPNRLAESEPARRLAQHSGGAETDAGELASPPVASLLPEELLQNGEVIILQLKPSLWFCVLPALRFIVLTVLAALVVWQIGRSPLVPVYRQDVILVAGGVIVMRLIWQLMKWINRIYILTDRRVMRVRGVFNVQVFEARLEQIQHTQCLFPLLERLFGLGTISFATAGTGVPEAYWEMVAHPMEVHRTVVETLHRYRHRP